VLNIAFYFSFTGQCVSNSCYNGGTCYGGYNQRCRCTSNFEGTRCQHGLYM